MKTDVTETELRNEVADDMDAEIDRIERKLEHSRMPDMMLHRIEAWIGSYREDADTILTGRPKPGAGEAMKRIAENLGWLEAEVDRLETSARIFLETGGRLQ